MYDVLSMFCEDGDAVSYRLEQDFASDLSGDIIFSGGSMNALNSVLIEGFVSLDPIVKRFDDGKGVVHFSLGVPSYYKNKEGSLEQNVSFVSCDMFFSGDPLEIVKGQELRLVGRLKQDRWKDSTDTWNSKLKVVCEHVERRGH